MSDSDPGTLSDRVETAQERFQYGQGAAISIVAIAFIGAFMWLNVKRGKLADGVGDA